MVEIPSVACASKKKAFHLLWKDLCFKVPVAYKLAPVAIALFKTSCILQRVSLFKRGLSSWQSGIWKVKIKRSIKKRKEQNKQTNVLFPAFDNHSLIAFSHLEKIHLKGVDNINLTNSTANAFKTLLMVKKINSFKTERSIPSNTLLHDVYELSLHITRKKGWFVNISK